MRRRVFLVSFGSLTTGCLTSSPNRGYHITDHSMTTNTDRSSPIKFTASVIDQSVSSDSRGLLELSLTNSSQETQEVSAGTVPPFGVVSAKHMDGEGQFLLWRNYTDEGCVHFTTDGVTVCDIGSITKLSPRETISRRYEILPPMTETHPEHTVPPSPGRYRISDTLSYAKSASSESSELSFEVVFNLESGTPDAD